jgi:hypothetical protein
MTDSELIDRLKAMVARGGSPDDETVRGALGRLDTLLQAAPRRTLPVRVAVVMSAGGGWYAWGENGRNDHDMCEEALGQVGDDPKVCYIITADVPVPEVREIEGTATEFRE